MGSSSSGRYHSGGGWDEPVDTNGFSSNTKGLLLAIGSSLCIGASFIIKKKGLKLSSSRANSKRAGDGGFGYDPVFEVDGLTLSEMGLERKNQMSHRALALRALIETVRP